MPDELILMLQEAVASRGGEMTHEEAKALAEEIGRAVSTPWLSQEWAQTSGKLRED
ncbi:MAG: hypothetical protein PHN90_00160 [Methanothrix sp.]|nr:hypothetical protein [Methanothrix sp.]